MTWTDFFLICFTVGLTFSVISLLAGSMHIHLPHFHVHFGVEGCAAARRRGTAGECRNSGGISAHGSEARAT